ncbi:DUF4132 domain-containing protein [Actinomadura harenae]|uniref:DUF4132 domain-containing protein n=1 Tax=Actinomadura harenae TaxID=2483351 RepID=A0A3M2M5A0_9ACTN|nr:DUF4132 domain-containing protein [Actinomadura harenae]RMI44867.1 DUF4132 domain-containing protein [Actinomadura harenae]
MERPLPDLYADAVGEQRELLWRRLERVWAAANAGDRPALRDLAEEILDQIKRADDLTIGNFEPHIGDILTELDAVYDVGFPASRPDDITDILTTPWPSARRKARLAAYLGVDVRHRLQLDELAERAVAAADVRLLRLLVLSPLGTLRRETVAQVLNALHQSDAVDTLYDAMDDAVVERAFANDPYLGKAIAGPPPLPCADAVRDHVDELTWRLVNASPSTGWDALPKAPAPRGLRFVQVALSWQGDRHVSDHLGVADLTDAERAALLDLLRDLPDEDRRRAFDWRLRAGDADALLPLFGLEGATSLFHLIQAMPSDEVVRQDRAAFLAAIEEAGEDAAGRLLRLVPNELASAVTGSNRAQVLKRVKNNALQGLAAFGMLPLAPDETVLDRYLVLRESAKKGLKLGPNRRHSHAAAVSVALDHLAQVAGFPDASRLEWDCEARIATGTTTEARVGDYSIALRFEGAEPVMTVSRAGKALKSVPSAVRTDPAYKELRESQKLLQDQARRMRTGLLERLVATSAPLVPDELTRLLSLPVGAAMLPGLLWQDEAGAIGLLDQVDTSGPVTAVHPFDLHERRELDDWQAEIARRRLTQPVKQVFRELYYVTPEEREAGDVSHRFAGRTVDGKVAGQLLAGRGWFTHGEYDSYQATRAAGGDLIAALRCDFRGFFGMGEVHVGEIRFLTGGRRAPGRYGAPTGSGGAPIPLVDVPPVAFSEVMRDLDLIVSVAGTEQTPSTPNQFDDPIP